MPAGGQKRDIQRFMELFPNHTLFIIQGLQGTGKRTFLNSILSKIEWRGEIHRIKASGSFEELIRTNLGDNYRSAPPAIVAIEGFDNIADFSVASKVISSWNPVPGWKWVILTNRALHLTYLDRMDICTFTMNGLSPAEARGWLAELSLKNNLATSSALELQTILEISGGHPHILKLLFAFRQRISSGDWRALFSQPEFMEFRASISRNLSNEAKNALEEIALHIHGASPSALEEFGIDRAILSELEDRFLTESEPIVRFRFQFLRNLFERKPERRDLIKLYKFYNNETESTPNSSFENQHSLGLIAAQLGKKRVVKRVTAAILPQIRHTLHAKWALELIHELEQLGIGFTPEMKLAQIDCLHILARYGEGEEKINQLENTRGAELDPGVKTQLRRNRIWTYYMEGKYQRAVDEIEEYLKQNGPPPPWEYINDLNNLAFNYVFLGQFRKAKEIAEESLSIQATLPENISCFSNSFLVIPFDVSGDYTHALALGEKFLADATRTHDRFYQALLYRFLAKINTELGNYARAEEQISQSLATFSINENPFAKYSSLSLAARIAGLQGKYKNAKELNEECCQMLELFPKQFAYIVAKYHLSIIESDQGNYETAKSILLEIEKIATETNCRPVYARIVAKLADIEFSQGKPYDAYKKLELAKELNRDINDPLLEQVLLGSEAKLSLFQGDISRASSILEQAMSLAQNRGIPYPEAIALNRLAEIRLRQGNVQQCVDLLAKSKKLHEQLGDIRGETDDIALQTRIAMKEGNWNRAEAHEEARLKIIRQEQYTRLIPSSLLSMALIRLQQKNPQMAVNYCEEVISSKAEQWEKMAAWKIIRLVGSETDPKKSTMAAEQIEKLDGTMSPMDRHRLDTFFSDINIEQPREFLVITSDFKKQQTYEELQKLTISQFDVWANFTNNDLYEKQLGYIDLGKGTLLRKLFETLISSPGRIFSKEELCREVWENEYHPLSHDPKIYFMINRLRKLIEPSASYIYILNIDNGYMFNPKSNFCIIKRTDKTEQVILNPRQKSLLKLLQSKTIISNNEYRKKFSVSNATAYRDLNELTKFGFIQREGEGRAAKYRSKDR